MKKIIHILLAFLLFVNSGGFVIVFYQMRNSLNKDMFEYIKCNKYLFNEVVNFRIHKNNLFKDKNGFIWDEKYEFKKENKLYDIVEITVDKNDNNYVLVYAINDVREESMLKTFSSQISKLANESAKNNRLRTMLSTLILKALPVSDFSFVIEQNKQIPMEYNSLTPLSFYKPPTTPPPKFS